MVGHINFLEANVVEKHRQSRPTEVEITVDFQRMLKLLPVLVRRNDSTGEKKIIQGKGVTRKLFKQNSIFFGVFYPISMQLSELTYILFAPNHCKCLPLGYISRDKCTRDD